MNDAPKMIWINWTDSDRECPPTAVGACTTLRNLDQMVAPVDYIRRDAPELVALREAAACVERDFSAGSEWESMALSRLYDALAAFDALVKG